MGFFSYLVDSEWAQRRDIDELRDQLRQHQTHSADGDELSRVSAQVTLLAREVAVLKTALSVLSHALVEVGGIDAAVLDARIDEAIAQRLPAVAAAPSRCGNCGLSYAAEQMAGELCKRCRALASK